ncbi:ABC transporter substrate-binding protein [Algoriphagus sp.]|uniref:ABC transporter substrate-binding protein n=1 Tax=Algoriphagus sp. TaxID=1872435 RepID=UPI0039191740
MKNLRIIGVPEHFNFPFRLLEKDQPFEDRGIQIQWIDESRGSGQMNQALRNDEADIAILLTESFLKDFEAGNPSKMIGYHVQTPLNWGIHVRADSQSDNLFELPKKHFLVSRMDSGSHLMALVLAKREGWNAEELSFEIIGNIDGAKEVMDNGNEGLFLWEKYTTAPMVKNGTMKLIGEVASPWPCFVMVASEKALEEFGDIIFEIRNKIYSISSAFSENPNLAAILAAFYNLDQNDVEKWLDQMRWSVEAKVSSKELKKSMGIMKELRIIKRELSFELFLTLESLRLED